MGYLPILLKLSLYDIPIVTQSQLFINVFLLNEDTNTVLPIKVVYSEALMLYTYTGFFWWFK